MRHTVTAAAVLLLALTTTACSNNGDGSGGGDAKPAPSKTASKQDAYLKTAHEITFNGSPTDAELTGYPPKWCEALDGGHSVKWLFSGGGGNLYPIGMDWGTVEKDADRLLVAGVRAYCPKYLDTVTAELRDAGKY